MKTLQGQMILLHGPPKVGKTQLASKFPGPVVFVATEPGHRYLSEQQKKWKVNLPPEDGWTKFRAMLDSPGQRAKAKTWVVDTIEGLYDLCMRAVCAKNEWKHPSDADYGKGWDAVKKEMYDALNKLAWLADSNNATLILIDHSREMEMTSETQKWVKVVCGMPGQCRGIVMKVPDHIWFLGYKDMDDVGENLKSFDHSARALYVLGGPKVEAGTRDPDLDAGNRDSVRIAPLSKEDPYKQIVRFINRKTKK